MGETVRERVANLNADSSSSHLNRAALAAVIDVQGAAFQAAVSMDHAYLFSDATVFVTAAQVAQMKGVIAAAEEVLSAPEDHSLLGVFYGYDFHLNEQGTHLIEINTNAGGAFLNALLINSQCDIPLQGAAVSDENLDQVFVEMFQNEWRLVRGDAPLKTIAIVDEQSQSQFLYPEFLLTQKMFERAGITAYIADPSALHVREDSLYFNDHRVDLIYNRLTDFDLRKYPHIRTAWEMHQVVLTPNPIHHQRYADKRKLAILSDAENLRSDGISQASIGALLQGVPQTRIVHAEESEQWWAERKQWFFKPVSGYGSKGAYRGDKLTKRVFGEIMELDYVAQRLAWPGERKVCTKGRQSASNLRLGGVDTVDGVEQSLKYDVRCYVYDGHIQLIAARLYQGQTTNFRTPGGGFALVRVVT